MRAAALTTSKPFLQVFFLLMLALSSSAIAAPIKPAPLPNKKNSTTKVKTWKNFAQDLDYKAISSSGALFSTRLDLFRTSLSEYRVAVVRAQDFGKRALDVRSLCLLSGAALCINANFFDGDSSALGLVISKGIKFHDLQFGGSTLTGIFSVTSQRPTITHRSIFNAKGVVDAVQAGPRLLSKGKKISGISTSTARRSGVCLDSHNRLIIFCASDGLLGLTFPQLQDILSQPGIDCSDALNFDGGGSTQLYVSGNLPKRSSESNEIFAPGRDPVPVALALFRRDRTKSK